MSTDKDKYGSNTESPYMVQWHETDEGEYGN